MEFAIATPDDIPGLCELLGELFVQETEFAPDPAVQARGLAVIIGDTSVGEILLARESESVTAMVSLLYTVSTALGAKVALLEDMVVSQRHRGQGIGGSLLKRAIAHAKAQGCRRITLLTDRDNSRARSLYAREGFSKSSMCIMRLPLDQGANEQ